MDMNLALTWTGLYSITLYKIPSRNMFRLKWTCCGRFTAGPILGSLALSFTQWEIISPAKWIGFGNFQHLSTDPLFYQALYNTAYISFLSVPLQLGLALLIALGLNERLRGVNVYRTIFFLPSQMPLVASALLWLWILNPDFGLANAVLGFFGAPPLKWLFDVSLAKPSIVMITLWGGVGTALVENVCEFPMILGDRSTTGPFCLTLPVRLFV